MPKIEVNEWTDTRFLDDVLRELGVNPKIDNLGRTIKWPERDELKISLAVSNLTAK